MTNRKTLPFLCEKLHSLNTEDIENQLSQFRGGVGERFSETSGDCYFQDSEIFS